jgi:hypothetical protein
MARLRLRRSIHWAGVEFQPNLARPTRPVRLGSVLLEVSASSRIVAIIGRTPKVESKPPEFEEVDAVTMALAAKWVDNMFKDILEGDKAASPFDLLARRWRWNLYVIEPKPLRAADLQGTLETITKKSYERFVGKPFEINVPSPKPKLEIRVEAVPPAWQLEALKQQSLLPCN